MPDFEARIRQGQNSLFRQLDRDFKKTSDVLYKSYQSYLNNTNSLVNKLDELASQRGLTAKELAQSEAAHKLQVTLRDDLSRYTGVIDRNTQLSTKRAGYLGLAQGAKNIEFAGLGIGFNRPNPRMIAALQERTQSTAFKNSLEKFAPYHADIVNNIMLVGAAEGHNPKTVARDIRRFVKDVPVADANRIVRTAQIWVARDGSIAVYRLNDDIVKGWIWSSALDDRTCESCIAQHGKHFSNSETLDDHYNGRCAPIPDVGLVGPIQTGEDWFNSLSEKRQRDILGPSKFAAWKDGAFEFSDLSKTYNDNVYGSMRRPATLTELVGHDMQVRYKKGETGIFQKPEPLVTKSRQRKTKTEITEKTAQAKASAGSLEDATKISHVEDYLRTTYPNLSDVDLKGMDLGVAKATFAQFDKLAKDYPEVAAKIVRFKTYEDGKGEWGNRVAKGANAYASSSANMGDASILFNTEKYRTNKSATLPDYNAKTAYVVYGSGEYGKQEATMTHEFGHMVDRFYRNKYSGKYFNDYLATDGSGSFDALHKQFWENHKPASRRNVSAYSKTNDVEGFAEAFSMYYHIDKNKWPTFEKDFVNYVDFLANPDKVKTISQVQTRGMLSPSNAETENIAIHEKLKQFGIKWK